MNWLAAWDAAAELHQGRRDAIRHTMAILRGAGMRTAENRLSDELRSEQRRLDRAEARYYRAEERRAQPLVLGLARRPAALREVDAMVRALGGAVIG